MQREYAADTLSPISVASIYNEPTAVLDVPRRARQRDVYGNYCLGKEWNFSQHELLTLLLEPLHKVCRCLVAEVE